MLARPKSLRTRGILGINRRNASYLLRYNKRSLYPRVDNKIITKQLAQEAGVAVPELYGVVEYVGQVKTLGKMLEPYQDFVIKPARGSTGEGILVISDRRQQHYRKTNGRMLNLEEIQQQVFNILSGMSSLGGHPDKALIEYRVRFDPLFEEISYQGIPDIRIILLFGVPVASMIRLPTQLSDGKANLHQGAVGAGIDIATGCTLNAVWQDILISEHPDTGNQISGLQIPGWQNILSLASKCYEFTEIAYQGVDIVLDRDKGPLLLEVNARPGLNIQIANDCGLLPRLRTVEQEHQKLETLEQRIQFAIENFSTSA